MTRASRAVMLAALCLGVLLVGIELFITAVALPQIFFDLSEWSELRSASWIITMGSVKVEGGTAQSSGPLCSGSPAKLSPVKRS